MNTIHRLYLAFFLIFSGCAIRTGTPERPHREDRRDPWSQAALEAYLDEVLPLVEEAAGRRFEKRPTVAVADEKVFSRLLTDEQLRIYERVMPDTPATIRMQLAEAAGRYMTSGILGKYVLETETVYLCPSALIPAMDDLNLAPSRTADLLKVVVAHEIVHALEDQHTDLEGVLDELADEDALWAASAAWEGWATLVEERVAHALGLQDIYAGLLSLQGWSEDGITDRTAWRTWAIYGQGKNFMEWHLSQGGVEQVWATLTDPPSSTSMLFRPETWSPEVPRTDIDYASVLRGVEQILGEGDWLVTNSRLGEFDLRGEATRAGNEADLDRILGHLRAARRLDAARPDRSGGARVLVFEDAFWARAYLDLLREQKTYGALETALTLDLPVHVTYTTFEQLPADDAFLRIQRMPLVGNLADESYSAWIQRDEVIVVVEASRFEPGDALGLAARQIFDRLARVRASTRR